MAKENIHQKEMFPMFLQEQLENEERKQNRFDFDFGSKMSGRRERRDKVAWFS